jgi:hypothetical protein
MRRMRVHLHAVSALVLVLGGLGCSNKDAAKCQEATDTTRKAVASGDYTVAGEWRNRAYTYCEDQGALAVLDKEIVDKQAADGAAKQAEAQRAAENDAVVKLFVNFASSNRAAPDRASVSTKCDGDDADGGKPDPKKDPKALERLCSATRSAGVSSFEVHYWDADHTIEMFSTKLPQPTKCDALGPNKSVKTWDVPAVNGASVKRWRCEFTSGPLAGMQMVTSGAANAPAYIFSTSFLDKDANMKKIAGG